MEVARLYSQTCMHSSSCLLSFRHKLYFAVKLVKPLFWVFRLIMLLLCRSLSISSANKWALSSWLSVHCKRKHREPNYTFKMLPPWHPPIDWKMFSLLSTFCSINNTTVFIFFELFSPVKWDDYNAFKIKKAHFADDEISLGAYAVHASIMQ